MNNVEIYDKVDNLVLQYQSNLDPQRAAHELTLLFSPLFEKYSKIIKENIIDFSDSDSCKFISLFIGDNATRRELKGQNISSATKEAAYKVANSIKTALYPLSEEDLINEFIIILLTLALRHKAGKKFCPFLKSSFRYEVARFVSRFMNNPLSTSIELDETISPNIVHAMPEDPPPVEELDNNWIYGACSEIFADLTPLERLIIKLFYIDNCTDIEIAKMTGYHRNWIGIRRRGAVERIKQKLKDLKLLVEE